MPSHVTGKPNAEQYCMMSADSKNVYGNSRLQSPNLTLKLQGSAKVFTVKLSLWNLGFPFTFLESFSSLITAMYLVSSLHVGP